MKRVLIILTLAVVFLFTNTIIAQQNYKVVNGKLVADTTLTIKAETTKFTIDIDNKSYPVFKTPKGKYFIKRVSKKTGNEYKQYINISE